MKNTFHDCEKSLTISDIRETEKKLGYTFDDGFVSHYRQFNGDIPEKCVWDFRDYNEDNLEPIEIADFFSIKYCKPGEENSSLIYEHYHFILERKAIPMNLIPFARDWGGAYFCIDKNNGHIFFTKLNLEKA